MAVTRAFRSGNAQIYARVHDRDDGTYSGQQLGLVTYDEDENYRITYWECGGRSDHLYDFVGQSKSERKSSDPAPYDADIIRPNPVTEAVEADRAKRDSTDESATTD